MLIVRGIEALSHAVIHPVVTIGNFDGVHLGHQKIIQLAVEKSRSMGGQVVAYTFRPHPQVALRPGSQVQLLMTYDEKLEALEKLGVDLVIEEPFSREFSIIEPEIFFNEVLLRKLSAENIVVGYDFAFGKERHGHLEALALFCKNAKVELHVVQPQRIDGEVVSSSKIRQHLMSGEMEAAGKLMGRSFFYRGIVIRGEGRGHKIGFPTANLKLEDKLALPYGVYATWAIHEGILYPSVTNVGVRPTFQVGSKELPALVETHLLNTAIDLYGDSIEVQFEARLRGEQKFTGIESLKAQIRLDAIEAERRLLAKPSGD
jgi:riboflavin kinase/FMN adenylyltransferase